MAEGLQYPKELTEDAEVHITKEMKLHFHDCLRDLAIIPYFGFWGVSEILYNTWGSATKGKLSFTRLLGHYKTFTEAKAFLEGFMAGSRNRKPIPAEPVEE